jgi:choline dehydrogenase-like flavoprotein
MPYGILMIRETSKMNAIYGIDRLPPRKERYLTVKGDVLEYCDICIIGSGAAGAVLAKKFCDSGKSVILLERGGYFEGEDMNQRDEDMIPLLWKNCAANFTSDLRIAVSQGSCLGGSTVINDAVCFKLPDIVRRQWRDMGVTISDEEWNEAFGEVSAEIHVTEVREDELSNNSLMFRKGCQLMGYSQHRPNTRNCFSCMQCGLCHLGCHYETKQDMRVTYLHKALNNPRSNIKIYCDCSAERITYVDEIVEGVEGNFLDSSRNVLYKIRVIARLVVIAAGSIASTELLLKSFIAKGKAGKGLALHPVPFVLGDFPFEIRGIQGIPIAYALHDFGVTNGVENGGFLVEGIFLPPLQLSLLLPIAGGQHEELMMRYNHYAMAGVLVRDGSNGEINLTDHGLPRIDYSLKSKEIDSIARGVELISRMWFRLGASRVVTPHMAKPILKGPDEIPEIISAIKNDPKGMLLGSAHPQGANRMGNDPEACVVDSNCRVYGFRNLFVCDASVFPTAIGVNPQLTVMALATIVSERIGRDWIEYAADDWARNPPVFE